MTIGDATAVTGWYLVFMKYDGVLGLGFRSLSADDLPVFSDLIEGVDRSFSFFFGYGEEASQFVVPGSDSAYYSGTL
jgi:hypothetical protein